MSIEIINVSHRLNKKLILDNINIKINNGEIVSILGPNGAGKSTLIKIIAGDFIPSIGNVFYNKQNIRKISIKKRAEIRSVMSLPKEIAFNYKVKDIIEMCRLNLEKNYNDNFNKILNEISQECDIEHLLTRNYNSLSSGEKRRVSLARAMIQVADNQENDKFILLDEPTENLDPFYERKLMNIIRERKEKNYGVLMVQHNLNIANQYSDRILLIKNGKNIAFGKKEEIMTEEKLKNLYETPIFVDTNFINIKYNI